MGAVRRARARSASRPARLDEIAFLAEQLGVSATAAERGSRRSLGYPRQTGARRPFSHADDAEERHRPAAARERQRRRRSPAERVRPPSRSTSSRRRRRAADARSRCASSAGPRSSCSCACTGRRGGGPTSTCTSRSPPWPRGRRRSRRRPKSSTSLLPHQAATALVIGYDRRASEGKNAPSAVRHADARPRRPARQDDLAALVPARPLGADPLPGRGAVHGEDQLRLRSAATTARSRRSGR